MTKGELGSAGSGDRYCGADSAPHVTEMEQAAGILASSPRSELAVIDMTSRWSRPYSFVRLVGGRWTLVLLAKLAAGGRRYQDLHGALDGVSHKVLTDTLRRAERDGLISRHVDAGRMETATLYALSDLGRSLDEPLGALGRWVEANWDLVEAAQREWEDRTKS